LKKISALLAVAAIATPFMAKASDGTINFSGSLISTTCTVTNGGATALSVALQQLATTSLDPATNAKTSGDQPFSLNISGCNAGLTTATTYFEADQTKVDQASGTLTNQDTGPANVAFELTNADKSHINLASTTQGVAAAQIQAGGTATANFYARYYRIDNNLPVAGPIKASITYSMVYN